MLGLTCARPAAAVLTAGAAVTATALLTASSAVALPRPIIGGIPTTTAEYPFVMQLTDVFGKQFCGGTLVTDTKVVTAAHCVARTVPGEVRVVGGRTFLDGTDGTVSEVSRIWVDPGYMGATRSGDVAVLTLATPMPYAAAKYAASSDTGLYEPGTTARILGWGTTVRNGPSSNQLRTATVPLVSDTECQNSYGSDFVASDMVCAGHSSGGVDTCQGDSGGPLLVGGVLAGITSWGHGCAEPGYPGVYTRVSTFSDHVTAQLDP